MTTNKSRGTAIWVFILGILLVVAFLAFYMLDAREKKAEYSLIISEAVSSNNLSLLDDKYGSPDWVELQNISDTPINLSGYTLVRMDDSSMVYELEADVLQPGEYYVIYACEQTEQGTHPCTGYKLPKSGTTLQLVTPSGAALQELKLPCLETDTSYGVDESGSYQVFAIPSPGKKNGSATELAGLKGSQVSLVISEVLPYGKEGETTWVELFNSGSRDIPLNGYFISDNPENTDKSPLPDITLKAGEYLVLEFSDSAAADALPFGINRYEDGIYIFDLRGNPVSQLKWDTMLFDGYSAGTDENGQTVYFDTPTKGAKNGSGKADFNLTVGTNPVIINEILRDNAYSITDSFGERAPWVELFNASESAVDLSEYYLSDDEAKAMKWQLPAVMLEPGEYYIVFLTGNDQRDGEAHSSFRLGGSDSILSLASRGVIQKVPVNQGSGENVSFGMSQSGEWLYFAQPSPGAANTAKGFAELSAANAQGGVRTIVINEVSAAKPAKSSVKDWVELHNTTESDIDVSGWVLSDSDDPSGGVALSGSVSPGGYLVSEGLKVSSTGENLYLFDAQGTLVDSFRTGLMRPGYSTGLSSDGTARLIFASPTKGANNGESAIKGYCAEPVLSRQGGSVDEAFRLTIACTTPGAAIYYTTDGSTPTTSSNIYSDALSISGNTCVKAIAVSEGYLQSDQTVATYIFAQHQLPVVCLSMSESDLSYISASAERRDERERSGYVEYYDGDGSLGVGFPAGFRIGGNGTRLYPQRSFNVYLRDGYGRGSVTYPFFGDYGITEFSSFGLRNFGQDASNTLLRDAYCSMAVEGMNMDYAQSSFVVCYINGKYWGLYEFKENINDDYFEAKYGVDPDLIQGVRSNTYVYNGVGNNQDIKSLFALAGRDTSQQDIYGQYLERADEDYFIDYIIARLFFSDGDVYNQKYMRATDYSLKWRPIWYDMDLAFGGNSPSRNLFSLYFRSTVVEVGEVKEDGTRNFVNMGLYYGFYKNPLWREKFVTRAAEVLNTVLTTDKLLRLFDEMTDQISTEIKAHVKRWNRPSSVSAWESNISELRNCISKRRAYFIEDLKDYFDISDERMKELFPND